MLSYDFITQKQFDQAVKTPITTHYHAAEADLYAPYVAEFVRQRLVAKLGDDVYTKGFSVYTTIDSKMQRHANAALIRGLLEYDMRHGYRGPEKRLGNVTIVNGLKALDDFPEYAGLNLALITQVGATEVRAVMRNKTAVFIPWSGLAWARPEIGELKMGATPKSAQDILKPGDVVRVVQSTDGVWRLSQKPEVEGALVAIRPDDGAVLALVGGYDFEQSPFNRAIQAERQPGSNFKPFVYAAALDNGFTAASIVNDAPVVIEGGSSNDDDWRPQNNSREFQGPTPLRIGLIESRNLVSIRILQSVGINKTIDYLTRFGFDKTKLPVGLSLALGTLSTSPLELANGYAILANGGYKVEPYYIDHVMDGKKEVFHFNPIHVCRSCDAENAVDGFIAPQVIPAENAYIMTDILKDTIKRGTAKAAMALGRDDLAGKTGTTNDQRDAWFSGYNSDVAVTAWVGFDDHKRSTGEYGSKAALPIWMEFMRHALAGRPSHSQAQPPGIVTARIDPATGLLARDDQTNAINEIFRQDNVPTQYSPETPYTEVGNGGSTNNAEPLY